MMTFFPHRHGFAFFRRPPRGYHRRGIAGARKGNEVRLEIIHGSMFLPTSRLRGGRGQGMSKNQVPEQGPPAFQVKVGVVFSSSPYMKTSVGVRSWGPRVEQNTGGRPPCLHKRPQTHVPKRSAPKGMKRTPVGIFGDPVAWAHLDSSNHAADRVNCPWRSEANRF